MSIFEYDEIQEKEKMRKAEYEAGLEAGHKAGLEAGHKAGCKEGKSQGEQRIRDLYCRLLQDNRKADIVKALEDIEYQKKLLSEYGL